MKILMQSAKHNLHFIFFGSLLVIYVGLYFIYGDALLVASGAQDDNFVHFYDVKSNFDTWKHDLGGTNGSENYHLVSLSYWLPIFISEVTGVSTLFFYRVQTLL